VSRKLRNQRTRQKLALAHERAKVEAEDDREREELRRFAAVFEERRRKALRTNRASNDPASVQRLRQILKKVDETEVILTDVQNKKRKEEKERGDAMRLSRRQ
jgi:hypothetical protein